MAPRPPSGMVTCLSGLGTPHSFPTPINQVPQGTVLCSVGSVCPLSTASLLAPAEGKGVGSWQTRGGRLGVEELCGAGHSLWRREQGLGDTKHVGGLGASPDTYLPTWAVAAVSTYLSGGPPLPGGLPSTSRPGVASPPPPPASPIIPYGRSWPQFLLTQHRKTFSTTTAWTRRHPFVFLLRPEPHLVMRKAISDHFRLFHRVPSSASWPPAIDEWPARPMGTSACGGSQAQFLTPGSISHSSKPGWGRSGGGGKKRRREGSTQKPSEPRQI